MNDKINWLYDEFVQVGKDYGLEEEVQVYDESHAGFRDVDEENEAILNALEADEHHTLIDFGSGTGKFAVKAAHRCRKVIAVDVSKTMIHYAQKRAINAGVKNIAFHHSGFLRYQHKGELVDAVVSNLSFHHLPDFWKGIALQRIHKILKPGGKLFMNDVVIAGNNAFKSIQTFIDKQAAAGGDFLREDAEMHFRDEFSTYDWIMEGLFERSGFTLLDKQTEDDVIISYLCQKN